MYTAKGKRILEDGEYLDEMDTPQQAKECAEIFNNEDIMREVFIRHLKLMDIEFRQLFVNWTEKCTELVVSSLSNSGSYFTGDNELPEVGLKKEGELYKR